MDERLKLGFEFAREIATQLITLSTGFLALTITFTKELAPSGTRTARGWLYGAWALHVLSILCGVWALMALTGSLVSATDSTESTFGTPVRLPALLQVLSFVVGLVAVVIYGVTTLSKLKTGPASEKPSSVPTRRSTWSKKWL